MLVACGMQRPPRRKRPWNELPKAWDLPTSFSALFGSLAAATMTTSSPTTVVDPDPSLFERALRLIPFSDDVVIMGSFALWEYQRTRSAKDARWAPGDVDIFITNLENQESFEQFVDYCMELAQSHGLVMKRMEKKNSRSAIIDVFLGEGLPMLSFIKRADERAGGNRFQSLDDIS